MLNILNVITIFGIGFDFDLSDAVFWLYVAQAVVVFIGIILFLVLLARTRKPRKERVYIVEEVKPVKEKKKKEKKEKPAVVAEEAATTAAEPEPQPQVIVVNPTPEPEKEKEVIERVLTGISLDVGVVQREFTVGEDFNCDGLLVRANYNIEPLTETLIAYSVVAGEVYDRLSNVSEIKVCYVLRPDLDEAGIKFVTVKYADQTAIYTISVKEAAPVIVEEPVREEVVEEVVIEEETFVVEEPTPIVEEEPAPVVEEVIPVEEEAPVEEDPVVQHVEHTPIIIEEESVEAGKLRYDRSFTARYIQSEDEIKHWYTEIKNELLSYKKTKGRISWKRETFKSGKEVVAKLAFRGKTLCLFLPLNAADYENTEYPLEDASGLPSTVDTPSMIRLKNNKRVKLAIELLEISMQQKGITRIKHVSEDFYVPYEGVVELINKGLIKREVKTSADEAIFVRDKVAEGDEDNDADNSTVTEISTRLYVSSKSLDEAEETTADTAEEPVVEIAVESAPEETAATEAAPEVEESTDTLEDGKKKKKKKTTTKKTFKIIK